jgi:hypothetical protein
VNDVAGVTLVGTVIRISREPPWGSPTTAKLVGAPPDVGLVLLAGVEFPEEIEEVGVVGWERAGTPYQEPTLPVAPPRLVVEVAPESKLASRAAEPAPGTAPVTCQEFDADQPPQGS